MRFSTWFLTLVLLVGLGIGREAQAGATMDWSEYLEPAGSRPPARATPTQRPAKATTAPKKASRTVAKKAGSKAKKTKRSARTSRRR